MIHKNWVDHSTGEEIIGKFGLPRSDVSCPGCGDLYGRYRRKVCSTCEECSSCCACEKQELMDADTFISTLL